MSASLQIISHSIEQTLELGQTIAKNLKGGETITLIGQLGSGKTHLVKGLALGLGVPAETVSSPTFTLINEYEGQLLLYHIDAYRLDNADQLAALGFDELSYNGSIVVIEWADLVWSLVSQFDPMCITINHSGETERTLEFKNISKSLHKALQKFI